MIKHKLKANRIFKELLKMEKDFRRFWKIDNVFKFSKINKKESSKTRLIFMVIKKISLWLSKVNKMNKQIS